MVNRYNEKITKTHPHNRRRRDGKPDVMLRPKFAKTCKLCREERVTRY